jgi:dUTP pyrophosphatase
MEIKILDSRLHELGFAPATPHSAGYDLRACLDEAIIIYAGGSVKIHTGIALHMNTGHMATLQDEELPVSMLPCAVIMPRSGLGCKGIKPRNAPGLIDADYQGEIIVCLYNGSESNVTIEPMERIAQLVFMLAAHPKMTPVSEFATETVRGAGGFGSTGGL